MDNRKKDQTPSDGTIPPDLLPALEPEPRTITSVVTVEVPDDAPVPFPDREDRLASFLDK